MRLPAPSCPGTPLRSLVPVSLCRPPVLCLRHRSPLVVDQLIQFNLNDLVRNHARHERSCIIPGDVCQAAPSFIKQKRYKVLRAMERSNGFDTNEGSPGSNEDGKVVANDALRASIKKSKEILEMHRNLLQQIAERKNLLSILNNTKVNIEQDSSGNERFLNKSSEMREDEYISMNHYQSIPQREVGSEDEYITRVLHRNIPQYGPEDEYTTENLNRNIPQHKVGGEDEYITENLYRDSPQREAGAYESAHPTFVDLYADRQESSRNSSDGSKSHHIGSYKVHSHKPSPDEIWSPAIAEFPEVNAAGDWNEASSVVAANDLLNVILVAAECAPWSKTGGLADVAGSLPKALARRGHRVMAVSPRYGNYAEPVLVGEPRKYKIAGQDMEVTYFHVYVDGVDYVFLDSAIFRNIESDIYGGDRSEIFKRMILLCKAAVEAPWHVPCGGACYGDGNLVFIANDWHTALLPVYLKAYYRDHELMIYARCVLVIHNIAHQGRGPVDEFSLLDLPNHYLDLFRLYDPYGGDHINIFSAGIKAADQLVTVSHGYAWELKTPEGGWGLHGVISENDWKFQGIVNGIDTMDWNPKFDVHLNSDGYTNYSIETVQTGKAQCKSALQRELGLPVRSDVPLIGFIGRLDHQKGVDLIAEAMPWIAGQDAQLVLLGSGRHDLEDTLRRIESYHYDRVRGWVGFSVRLAHRITAGADILLMPSRFEPCGLNQLYAMMYGTIPVVHAVGGLRDTVSHFNPYEDTGFGWTFESADANRMIDALGHCLNTFRNYKHSWEGLQQRCMSQDLSWDSAARLYEEVLIAAKYQW